MRNAIILAVICSAAPAWAARVTIETQIDERAVQVQQQFALDVVVTVEGQGDAEYSPPDFAGFSGGAARHAQHGQSFVMNFGSGPKITSTTTYLVLHFAEGARGGHLHDWRGESESRRREKLQTQPIEIQVGGSSSGANAQARNRGAAQGRAAAEPSNAHGESVLLQVIPDKFDAYVGEQVILSVYLLSRVELPADIQEPHPTPARRRAARSVDDRPRH